MQYQIYKLSHEYLQRDKIFINTFPRFSFSCAKIYNNYEKRFVWFIAVPRLSTPFIVTVDKFFWYAFFYFSYSAKREISSRISSVPVLSVMVTPRHPSTSRRCFISTGRNTLGPLKQYLPKNQIGEKSSIYIYTLADFIIYHYFV